MKHLQTIRGIVCGALYFCCFYIISFSAQAQFQANVTIINTNSAPVTQSFSISQLTARNLFAAGGANTELNGAYHGLNSAIAATLSISGRSVVATIPMNSATVTVTGSSGTETFNTGMRIGSLQAAIGTFINNVNSPNNPSNPAIGNPQSLAGRMIGGDFSAATGIGNFDESGSINNQTSPGQGVARTPNALTAGGEFSYASAGGQAISTVTVPIDYTYYFADPRYSILVDVPVTYLRVGNADVGQASIGATFKFPVIGNWSLAVAGRVGAVGSEDLLLGNIAYSGSLGSQYLVFFKDYKITIGNSVGAIETSPFRVGSITTGPSRLNVPLVNGASVEGSLPFTVFDKPTSYEAYAVDTYFAGQQIAIRHYDEIGLNVGTRRVVGDQSWDTARLGISYTVGKSFNMVSLRASYRF